jgi:uncharacterized membrane protein YhhN
MSIEILSAFGLLSAILAITYRQRSNIRMYSIFKPLTTFIIILIAIIIYTKFKSNYSVMIIAALLLCLTGDIFLLDKRFFIYGLTSFLIAHIVFTIDFSSLYGFSLRIFPLCMLILITGSYFTYLMKDLNKYLIPVIIYLAAVVIMSWQAIGLIYSGKSMIFYMIAIASVLFLISDSILAFARFKKTFKIAEILILSTYWIALYIFTVAGIRLD